MPSERLQGLGSAPQSEDYPNPAFYFSVSFGSGALAEDTSFREVSGIQSQVEVESYTEGGENRFQHQLPKVVTHPRLVLRRAIARKDSGLVKWCKSVLEEDYESVIEPNDVTVRLLGADGNPVRTWFFSNAYPLSWEIEPFEALKNEVAIEKIELAYSLCVRFT